MLGFETNRRSKQSDRVEDLQEQLWHAGHLPVDASWEPWQIQLQHARAAVLAAVRIWNDPTAPFRTGSFALLLVTAWNSLAIAVLQKRGKEWRELEKDGQPKLKDANRKPETRRSLSELPSRASTMMHCDTTCNGGSISGIWFAHRCLPALDIATIPYAQASLLNFERILADEFGASFVLGSALSVPLQLTGFRDPGFLGSMKQLQATLPLDVQAFLARSDRVPDEILADPRYTMRVAFVPVIPASGSNPDVVEYFISTEDAPKLPDDVRHALIMRKIATPPRLNLNAKRVIAQVSEAIPFKFSSRHHTLASRNLKVRPMTSQADQSKTDPSYCEYVQAVKRIFTTMPG